ncbi:hypothetical protein SE17_29720, partial [Kouleothrix aurantiaca]
LGLRGRLLAAAEAGGRVGSVIEILLLQALAHEAHGDLHSALAPLARALALAEPEGYVRLFVDEGAPMAALLAQSVERRAQNDSIRVYAERLLSAFPEVQSDRSQRAQNNASALGSTLERSHALVEPLSEREREVLRLIAEGLSNQELAARLYLSPHTIKVHTRNIYGKLGVTSRTQALARARALGILGMP